jgi:hypothetical protein
VFTVRYGPFPYIKKITFSLKKVNWLFYTIHIAALLKLSHKYRDQKSKLMSHLYLNDVLSRV